MTPPPDHKAVLATIPVPERQAMQRRSDGAGLRHLALHLGALATTTLFLFGAGPLWWLALLPQGVLLCFLFTLQHECTHDTPFASRWLNRLVGHATGLVLIQPFTWFRHFHMAHHRHTNDPARDPELAGGGRPSTRRAWVWHMTGLPAWRGWAGNLLSQAAGGAAADFLPRRLERRVIREARVMLAIYALGFALAPTLLLWAWVVPMLLGQPFLRLYLLAEHGHCPPVADMLENTRTTHTGRLVRALAWNMPYHIEHHSAPNVPFHQLPALHAHMAEHLRSTSPSYRAFTRAYVTDLE